MNISLAEAIEIHAQALFRRHGKFLAAKAARERAQSLEAQGDAEGRDVWHRMTGMIEAFPDAKKASEGEADSAA